MSSPYPELEGLDPAALVAALLARHPGRVAALSSFGTESAVLLDVVAQVEPALPILFLDTGHHFPETLAHRDALLARLGLTGLRVVAAAPAALAADAEGFLWARDAGACCALRKVAPLDAALAGLDVILDGRKRHHGEARAALPAIRAEGGRLRVSPLAAWSAAEIEAHRLAQGLPAHPLAARGYASVGCLPCTTPTRPGEAPRAGRWRGTAKTECGIHP